MVELAPPSMSNPSRPGDPGDPVPASSRRGFQEYAYRSIDVFAAWNESTPETVDFTINSPATWEQYKPRLQWNDGRTSWEYAHAAWEDARRRGQFVCYMAHIGYDWIQRMVGAETVLVGMMQQADWIRDMFDTLMDLVLAGYQAYRDRGFVFDGCYVADDLGYKNGAFFSPAKFRELELPAQQRLCSRMAEDDVPVILHSCGNVTELVPLLIEAGFACLQPLEVKAGVDMLALKRQFGDRLSFMGGIDARAMSHPDPAVIEQEIATKLPVMKQGGGYIYHSDHSVPSDVSLAQYERVMALVDEYGRYAYTRASVPFCRAGACTPPRRALTERIGGVQAL